MVHDDLRHDLLAKNSTSYIGSSHPEHSFGSAFDQIAKMGTALRPQSIRRIASCSPLSAGGRRSDSARPRLAMARSIGLPGEEWLHPSIRQPNPVAQNTHGS